MKTEAVVRGEDFIAIWASEDGFVIFASGRSCGGNWVVEAVIWVVDSGVKT